MGSDLFIEKPLSHNFDGIDELSDVVERHNSIVGLGYQYRFHPGIVRAKCWLEDGRIGNPVSADFVNGEYMPSWHPWEDYRLSYGARADLGGGAIVSQIHEFDLLYWMFGLPESVFAVGGHLSSLEIDVELGLSIISCSITEWRYSSLGAFGLSAKTTRAMFHDRWRQRAHRLA